MNLTPSPARSDYSSGLPNVVRTAASIVLACFLASCSQGQRPFLIAQVCLQSPADVDLFLAELQHLSISEKLESVDASKSTAQKLAVMGAGDLVKDRAGKVVDVLLRRKDGVGVAATNVGLPGYQVAIGFSAGADDRAASLFAERIIGVIGERWRVEAASGEAGAKGLANCVVAVR